MDPELQAFCEANPYLALEMEAFVEGNREGLEAFCAAHCDIPSGIALTMALIWQELGYTQLPITFGKLWRARRKCDSCGCHLPAGEYLHMFCSIAAFTFRSFFLCPGCEDRWEELGECRSAEVAR